MAGQCILQHKKYNVLTWYPNFPDPNPTSNFWSVAVFGGVESVMSHLSEYQDEEEEVFSSRALVFSLVFSLPVSGFNVLDD